MNDLRIDLFVALRTAPKTTKRRFGSPRGALEGDAGTQQIVDIVFRVLEHYTVEPKPRPPPVLPRAG